MAQHDEFLRELQGQGYSVSSLKYTGTYSYYAIHGTSLISKANLVLILMGVIFAGMGIGLYALFTFGNSGPDAEYEKMVALIGGGLFAIVGILLVIGGIKSAISLLKYNKLKKHHAYEDEFFGMLKDWKKNGDITDGTLLRNGFIACAKIVKSEDVGFVAESEPIQGSVYQLRIVYDTPPIVLPKVDDIIHFCGYVEKKNERRYSSSTSYYTTYKLKYRILDTEYLNSRGWNWRDMQISLLDDSNND